MSTSKSFTRLMLTPTSIISPKKMGTGYNLKDIENLKEKADKLEKDLD